MTSRKIAAIFALAFLVSGSGLVPMAQASVRSDVDTNEKNYAVDVDDWETYGDAHVYNDGRVRLTSDERQSDYAYTDISISNSQEDEYALFVSFARAEKPYPDLSNGSENIAGLPYLYGYVMNDDRITNYVQGGSMRLSSSNGTSWHVIYGLQRIPDGTDNIRYFLKQAGRSGITPDGRAAWFYDPGLFIVDSTSDAMDVVDAYRDALDEFPDTYEYDRDIDTGTLVKCPGHPQVYITTGDNTMKLFWSERAFYAWHKHFQDVVTISCDELDDYKVTGIIR